LLKLGVAPEAIVDVGKDVTNTYEETLAVGDWARQTGAKKIIIITEKFPSRRVRWAFNRELAPIGVKVMVRAERNPEYEYERWWKSEYGIVEFENEVVKYVYYRFKY
jgi:uncharacterized SAM-binding protein YcdF (DUF218 family)